MTDHIYTCIISIACIDSCKLPVHTIYEEKVNILATVAKSKAILLATLRILLAFGCVAIILVGSGSASPV